MYRLGMDGRKWEIFVAAVNLFEQKSYHTVSMRELAGTVGIRSSSIYLYFDSKDEILENIYDFYTYNTDQTMPDLESLLVDCETLHPHAVLQKTVLSYPLEIEEMMAKVMRIIASLSTEDARAQECLTRNFITLTNLIIKPLLERMVALDKIMPLDIDSFLMLHTSLNYYAAFCFYSKQEVFAERWVDAHKLLYNLIQIKP